MNNVVLILPTYNPNIQMLNQALDCSDLFQEVILHINHKNVPKGIIIPKNCNVILKEERCSVEEALNKAINLCDKSFILTFSDDDYFHREALNAVLDHLKYSDELKEIIFYPSYVGLNDNWKIWGNTPIVTFESICEKNTIPFSCIYHKDVWAKINGYKDVPFSDWAFWIEALKQNCKFEYWPYPIYCHRQGHKETLANKQSKTFNKEEFLERLK
jgi:hypothetical protein